MADNLNMLDSFRALATKAEQLYKVATAARQRAAGYDTIATAISKGVSSATISFYQKGSGSQRTMSLSETEIIKVLELIGHERGKELENIHAEIQQMAKEL